MAASECGAAQFISALRGIHAAGPRGLDLVTLGVAHCDQRVNLTLDV